MPSFQRVFSKLVYVLLVQIQATPHLLPSPVMAILWVFYLEGMYEFTGPFNPLSDIIKN